MAQQVAHEIKNPLTPMKLNIQYLQKAAINNAPNLAPLALKISDGIIEQIDNLTNITTAFSNFAKLPENKPQDYCMNDLVANCVQLFNVQENITLDLQLASEKLYCHIDKDLFTQVMNNLVLNAIQSIEKDKNGFIQIMLSKNSSDALLEIKDNGVGIPTALHDKMFSPYITTKATGTGLGLAMTKQIIEQWNGKIGFDSVEGVYLLYPLATYPLLITKYLLLFPAQYQKGFEYSL
jgi:two-component system nitrogen regulation sensor histidine kinase NtrY